MANTGIIGARVGVAPPTVGDVGFDVVFRSPPGLLRRPIALSGAIGGLVAGIVVLAPVRAARAAVPVAEVAAEDEPDDEHSDAPVLTGSVDVGAFAQRTSARDLAAISPALELGIRARPEVEMMLGFGVATLSLQQGGAVRREVSPSNIMLGFRGIRERRTGPHRYRAHIGFGFALPTALVPADAQTSALRYALAVRGGWNPWMWQPASLGIVVPAGARVQVARRLELAVDVGVAALVASSHSQERPKFAAQVAGEIRYALPWVGVGVRAQEVYNGRAIGNKAQAAVAPQLDVDLCRRTSAHRVQATVGPPTHDCPVRLAARVLVNVDRPYGFASRDGMRVWGVQVGLGWALF